MYNFIFLKEKKIYFGLNILMSTMVLFVFFNVYKPFQLKVSFKKFCNKTSSSGVLYPENYFRKNKDLKI